MVFSTETFNQSVRTEYSEAVNARYTFQPLWVSGLNKYCDSDNAVLFRHTEYETFETGLARTNFICRTLSLSQ